MWDIPGGKFSNRMEKMEAPATGNKPLKLGVSLDFNTPSSQTSNGAPSEGAAAT